MICIKISCYVSGVWDLEELTQLTVTVLMIFFTDVKFMLTIFVFKFMLTIFVFGIRYLQM